MTSRLLQVAPRPSIASHKFCTVPVEISVFFSFLSAKKPTNRPSGDQKGYVAPFVPGSDWVIMLSIDRIQSCWLVPSEPEAAKTNRLPSGDRASDEFSLSRVKPVGRLMEARSRG